MLQGKKVRENPLLDGLSGGARGDDNAVAPLGGGASGFGAQQQFALGKNTMKAYYGNSAGDANDEDGDGNAGEGHEN